MVHEKLNLKSSENFTKHGSLAAKLRWFSPEIANLGKTMNPCKHHNGSRLAIKNLRLLRQSGEMATRLREANHLGFDQFASVAHIGRCLQPFIGRRALKSPTRPSPDKAARPYGINAPLLLVRSLLYLDLFPATRTAIATQVGSIWIFQFESRLWSDGGLDFAPSTIADHPLGCVRSGATSRYSSHATLQRSTRDFKSLAFCFVTLTSNIWFIALTKNQGGDWHFWLATLSLARISWAY